MITIDTIKHLRIVVLFAAAVVGGCCSPIVVIAVLPIDPQAGIAIMFFSMFLPTIIAIPLAFFSHQAWVQLGIAFWASLGLFCFASRSAGSSVELIRASAAIAAFSFVPAAVAAAISGWLSKFLFDRRRYANGPIPCLKCGYSLVGLTSELCPECGSRVDFEKLGMTPEELARAARRGKIGRD